MTAGGVFIVREDQMTPEWLADHGFVVGAKVSFMLVSRDPMSGLKTFLAEVVEEAPSE